MAVSKDTVTYAPRVLHFSAFHLPNSKVSKFSLLIMFLMKIRLNLFDEDLADRFQVHVSTVSRNFHRVLDVLYAKLASLIKWPDRETLKLTMPLPFRKCFNQCCVIIDCSEIFMERPTNLLARAQVWSNYKHHSTLKFLIGIAMAEVKVPSFSRGKKQLEKVDVDWSHEL